MKIYFLRHAIAEDRQIFAEKGLSDDLRPLNSRGIKKMKQSLPAICAVLPKIDFIATSPLTRAMQTAEIFKTIYKNAVIFEVPALKPSASCMQTLKWLKTQKQKINEMLIIGHEPRLSQFASFLVTGKTAPLFTLKKGGLCVLEFVDKIDSGRAQITCIIQPSILRKTNKN